MGLKVFLWRMLLIAVPAILAVSCWRSNSSKGIGVNPDEYYNSGYSSSPSGYNDANYGVLRVYANSYDGFLNIRTGPSMRYDAIGQFWNGPDGAIYLDTASNGWIKINLNGIIGWVNGNYISYTPTPSYVAPHSYYMVEVDAYDGFVNIRDRPSARGNIIGMIYNTSSICDPVLSEASNGWLKINHNGTVGWVNPNYVTVYGTDGLLGDGRE